MAANEVSPTVARYADSADTRSVVRPGDDTRRAIDGTIGPHSGHASPTTPLPGCDMCSTYQCYTGWMANLTLSLDDDVLRRARERAAANGTSVNQLVRDYLERLVGPGDRAARVRILALADAARSSSGPDGRSWDRESLHER